MNPLFAFMGGVAKASGKMSRFSINMIPSNWLLIGLLLVMTSIFWSSYQKDHDIGTLVGIAVMLIVAGAFVGSSFLRHTIFQKGASVAAQAPSAFGGGAPTERDLDVPMRMTGRLRLTEKVAQRFLDVPVGLMRLDDGQLAFVSRIDASSRLYGAVVNSKSGVWLSIPRPDSLEVEEGLLYHGFKPAPSLRLRYVDGSDGKPVQNIIAFESAQDRDAVRDALQNERSQGASKQQPFTNA